LWLKLGKRGGRAKLTAKHERKGQVVEGEEIIGSVDGDEDLSTLIASIGVIGLNDRRWRRMQSYIGC
jgi:hypothetical protein